MELYGSRKVGSFLVGDLKLETLFCRFDEAVGNDGVLCSITSWNYKYSSYSHWNSLGMVMNVEERRSLTLKKGLPNTSPHHRIVTRLSAFSAAVKISFGSIRFLKISNLECLISL